MERQPRGLGYGMDWLLRARTWQQLQFPFAESDWTKKSQEWGEEQILKAPGAAGDEWDP